MKADPAVIAAQNRRKIEKDHRRKHYHDMQVQGTNNSSIVSKRSVEMIYNPIMEPKSKEWFKHFVPKAKRRSPAINRGYWIRMETIKEMVERILAEYPNESVRVVNLGCGFDPLPFQLLDNSDTTTSFDFYDFDYPELVQRKLTAIKDTPDILDVIGPQNSLEHLQSLGVVLATDSYKLVGCDLKNTAMYEKQIHELLLGPGATIFIAEVSLAYMKPEHANPVISILSSLPNSHFLVLEQIMPAGENHFFAQKMLYHFDHLRSPLQCVQTYSTKDKQRKRFEQYFPNVSTVDMFESWQQLVSPEKKELIETVEHFDEWEEFVVFCQHYVVIHATNSHHKILKETTAMDDLSLGHPLKIDIVSKEMELKFPAACETENGVYVHGGMWQTRNDDLLFLEDAISKKIDVGNGPSARMCHTVTSLQNGTLLLVGGRTRPGTVLRDVWLYDESSKTWTNVGELEEYDLVRHSAAFAGEGRVIAFASGKFILLTVNDGKLTVEELSLNIRVPAIKSCGFAYDPQRNVGYIVGGISDATQPTFNEQVYQFSVDVASKFVTIETIMTSALTARSGCAISISDSKLYVIGGVGEQLTNQNTTIVLVNTATKETTAVPISDHIWKSFPVFIGFQWTGSMVIGGGAVCYSFGSVYNPIYRISLPEA